MDTFSLGRIFAVYVFVMNGENLFCSLWFLKSISGILNLLLMWYFNRIIQGLREIFSSASCSKKSWRWIQNQVAQGFIRLGPKNLWGWRFRQFQCLTVIMVKHFFLLSTRSIPSFTLWPFLSFSCCAPAKRAWLCLLDVLCAGTGRLLAGPPKPSLLQAGQSRCPSQGTCCSSLAVLLVLCLTHWILSTCFLCSRPQAECCMQMWSNECQVKGNNS